MTSLDLVSCGQLQSLATSNSKNMAAVLQRSLRLSLCQGTRLQVIFCCCFVFNLQSLENSTFELLKTQSHCSCSFIFLQVCFLISVNIFSYFSTSKAIPRIVIADPLDSSKIFGSICVIPHRTKISKSSPFGKRPNPNTKERDKFLKTNPNIKNMVGKNKSAAPPVIIDSAGLCNNIFSLA